MTREKQIKLLESFDDELMGILKKKGNDYAQEADVLENFKRLSAAAKILKINITTPIGYALFMVIMKVDRITNLISQDKAPENESLEDSFKDGVNYLKLAYLLTKE